MTLLLGQNLICSLRSQQLRSAKILSAIEFLPRTHSISMNMSEMLNISEHTRKS